MDKSATFSETFKDARDLFKEGMYHKALSKFEWPHRTKRASLAFVLASLLVMPG